MKNYICKLLIGLLYLILTTTSLQARSIRHGTKRGHSAGFSHKLYGLNRPAHSPRVLFAADKPVAPPRELQALVTLETNLETNQELHIVDTESAPRQKRYYLQELRQSELPHPACQSIGQWVQKRWAMDIHDNNLTVVDSYEIEGVQVQQFFFETVCQTEENTMARKTCSGIDTKEFASTCTEKDSFVHGRVRDMFGTEGWTLIRLKTSCNCVVQRKSHYLDPDLLEGEVYL